MIWFTGIGALELHGAYRLRGNLVFWDVRARVAASLLRRALAH